MDDLKRQAAARALDHVREGMKLGLGTGSTAKHFVDLLGAKVRSGFDVIGVPTSEATRAQALQCGIRLTTLDEIDHLDLEIASLGRETAIGADHQHRVQELNEKKEKVQKRLGELEKRLATGPLRHDAAVPFFHFYGGKMHEDVLSA